MYQPATEPTRRTQTTKLPPTLHHHNRFTERAAIVARPIAMISTIVRTGIVVGHQLEYHGFGNNGTTRNIVSTKTQIKLAGPNDLRALITIGPSSSTVCANGDGNAKMVPNQSCYRGLFSDSESPQIRGCRYGIDNGSNSTWCQVGSKFGGIWPRRLEMTSKRTSNGKSEMRGFFAALRMTRVELDDKRCGK
jgi:hypothetical protein